MTRPIDDEPRIEAERYELFEPPRYKFEPDRRDFLKLTGAGILVCLAWNPAVAQRESGQRGRFRLAAPQDLDAWVHVSDAGRITVYTGKVEVGQNIRTSLSQVVAEELRSPVELVELVMADTDLVPYDFGTFGSRTTPSMAPQLRKVAAAARELLVDLAAEELGVPRESLAVADGKVSHAESNRSLSFGELAEGKKLTRHVGSDATSNDPIKWKIAGTSVPKIDAAALVTGAHRFASDVALPDMLFGKILRPERVGATLKSIDTSEAAAIDGVTVVHDGEFVGVAATSEPLARRALAAIRAEWKLPPASSGELFAALKQTPQQGGLRRFGRGAYSRGSIESGLAAADHKLQTTYTIAYLAHVPLEPRAAVAQWKDGKLTVWTGTQRPFGVRSELAQAFGLKPESVRVIVPDTGSGYGGKHTGEAAIEAARLAKAAGKPVKLVWTREEEFTWAYFRPAGVIEVSSGVTADGKITAWEYDNYNSGGSAIRPLYDIPNQRVQFHSSQAPLRQGSYRALAATANHFARESHVDAMAAAVKRDPLEFRLANLTEPRLRAVLEAAAGGFGWGRGAPAAGHGFGIAGGSEKGSYVATCAEAAVDPTNGHVRVVRLVTAFECGAILNPDHLKNQVEGAVVMGLGGALFEAIELDEHGVANPKFSRYRVPRFSDLPTLETVLLDRKDLPSAGAGETPIVAVAPAIAGAIFQACGVRPTSLPMAPHGVKV